MDYIEELIAYNQGQLSDQETVQLFQRLVDTGDAWKFGYGEKAMQLIEAGLVIPHGGRM